jgi:hypothetical protein
VQFVDMVIEASNAELIRAPDKGQTGKFQVRVLNSPAGEMRPEEAVAIAYDDKRLQDRLQQLDERGLKQADLIEFGRMLAGWLLPPKEAGAQTGVQDLYKMSLEQVGQDTGLRLRLRLPAQLAAIPWEYLYKDSPGGGNGMDGFLALNRRVAIVRHEVLDVPALSPMLPANVKAIVALASPDGFTKLDLTREKAILQKVFDRQSGLSVQYLTDARLDDIETATADAAIFHFAGHGLFTEQMGTTPGTYTGFGSLVLADTIVNAEQLGIVLRGHGVRLIVLGACDTGRHDGISEWGGVAPALVKVEIPAVVANQFTIQDSTAIAFHTHFYQALVGGLSIEEAVSAGRIAAYTTDQNGRDWGVAVLYLRAQSGQIFGGAADEEVRQKARIGTQEILPGRHLVSADNPVVDILQGGIYRLAQLWIQLLSIVASAVFLGIVSVVAGFGSWAPPPLLDFIQQHAITSTVAIGFLTLISLLAWFVSRGPVTKDDGAQPGGNSSQYIGRLVTATVASTASSILCIALLAIVLIRPSWCPSFLCPPPHTPDAIYVDDNLEVTLQAIQSPAYEIPKNPESYSLKNLPMDTAAVRIDDKTQGPYRVVLGIRGLQQGSFSLIIEQVALVVKQDGNLPSILNAWVGADEQRDYNKNVFNAVYSGQDRDASILAEYIPQPNGHVQLKPGESDELDLQVVSQTKVDLQFQVQISYQIANEAQQHALILAPVFEAVFSDKSNWHPYHLDQGHFVANP